MIFTNALNCGIISLVKKVENKRIYLFDNLKAILIFLVVFGHMIEYISGAPFYKALYVLIYSFHMPLFIYVSGYFANSNPQKTLKNVLYPYIVFQVLYVIFDRFGLKGGATLSPVSPYWHLWYLVVLFIYRCILPFFETKKKSKAVFLLSCAFFMSLVVGFDVRIGYYLSLSRAYVFFFFFLCGFYQRRFISFDKLEELKKNKKIKLAVWISAVVVAVVELLCLKGINKAWFYGSYAYSALDYNVLIRLMIMLGAIVFSSLLVLTVTNKKIPFVTYIGQNCIYIFLLHGFVVKLVNGLEIQKMLGYNILPIILISVLTMIIFANKYSVKILKPLVQFPERRIKNGNNTCNEQ